ncbi:MAG TPA: class 1 fructose-bisphosphatase [Azospirillaceae bacterium]|nr:class 1 fructose-bisphosphatase [Azospirillaceae bacterium]
MPFHNHVTLAQYLIEESRVHEGLDTSLVALLLDVAQACKTISCMVAMGALGDILGKTEDTNIQGEVQARLDVLSNDVLRRRTQYGGHVAAVASEEMDDPYPVPPQYPRGDYLLLYDPLDGSSNIDVNVSVGSIFSVLRTPRPGEEAAVQDFLQPGNRQVAAGYALYGPSSMLVITVGRGVVGFTLDPVLGDFVLTHPHLTVAPETTEFAINASNSRFWEPPIVRYVNECMAGQSGPREKDFNTRWIASLVADVHRILVRGGIFLYPGDNREKYRTGRLRLLYEASPVAFLIEQAGGIATTGTMRLLDVEPTELHQRIPLIFGSSEEVRRIENLYREAAAASPAEKVSEIDTPLFNSRGLFRAP